MEKITALTFEERVGARYLCEFRLSFREIGRKIDSKLLKIPFRNVIGVDVANCSFAMSI